jgi:hypothetical protein
VRRISGVRNVATLRQTTKKAQKHCPFSLRFYAFYLFLGRFLCPFTMLWAGIFHWNDASKKNINLPNPAKQTL